jgi:hypothetical protein
MSCGHKGGGDLSEQKPAICYRKRKLRYVSYVCYNKTYVSGTPAYKETPEKSEVHRTVYRNIYCDTKSNKTQQILKFIYFWDNTVHVSVFPSIIRSSRLYIQHFFNVRLTYTFC